MGKYVTNVKKDTKNICRNVGEGFPSPLLSSPLKMMRNNKDTEILTEQ